MAPKKKLKKTIIKYSENDNQPKHPWSSTKLRKCHESENEIRGRVLTSRIKSIVSSVSSFSTVDSLPNLSMF